MEKLITYQLHVHLSTQRFYSMLPRQQNKPDRSGSICYVFLIRFGSDIPLQFLECRRCVFLIKYFILPNDQIVCNCCSLILIKRSISNRCECHVSSKMTIKKVGSCHSKSDTLKNKCRAQVKTCSPSQVMVTSPNE